MNAKHSVIALITVSFLGCDSLDLSQQRAGSEGVIKLENSSLSKAPSESGVVIRWANDLALFAYFNPSDQVVSIHATVDALDWACGNDVESFEPLSVTEVMTPRGPTVARTNATLLVRVYSPSTLTLAELLSDGCSALQAQTLAAEGFLQQTFNDNDVWGYGGRTNSFSVRTHGRIDIVGGGKATYRLFRHWQISQDSDFRVVKQVGPELVAVK